MRKPSVYVDTNIFSVMHARSGNIFSLAWRLKTREWWEKERRFFALVTSGRTEDELAQGEYLGQAMALAAARRLRFLSETPGVKQCAALYLDRSLVPKSKLGDAIQLAFATVHRVNYLLTWNCAHLANVDVQRRLRELNESRSWRTPLLVSLETIPWVTLGQNVRRKDD
jgi:hypothetical protein